MLRYKCICNGKGRHPQCKADTHDECLHEGRKTMNSHGLTGTCEDCGDDIYLDGYASNRWKTTSKRNRK